MFEKRSTEIEIMDDLLCEGEVVAQTLRELDFINAWLGGNKITLDAIDAVFKSIDPSSMKAPVKIADLGCGSGDILKQIAAKARRKNIPVQLTGVDANPFIIDYARQNCRQYSEISMERRDILDESFFDQSYDVVNATLFFHHFEDGILADFIGKLYRHTRRCIIINDIHRHWLAYHSIKWLTHLFSSSDMVKNDAKLSVLRSFRKKEIESILARAGIKNYSIQWCWAFRYKIIIYCSPSV